MTLRECYAALGGDYENVVGRLMNEKIVRKFLFKFLDDASYSTLIRTLEAGDYEEAFRAAHTLKGVCSNLGLSRLLDSSSRMTEALRERKPGDYTALAAEVKADYEHTTRVIREFQAG